MVLISLNMSCYLIDRCDTRGQQAEDKSKGYWLSHRAFGCRHNCACEYRLEISLHISFHYQSLFSVNGHLHLFGVLDYLPVIWPNHGTLFPFQTMTLGSIVFKRTSKRLSWKTLFLLNMITLIVLNMSTFSHSCHDALSFIIVLWH